MMYTVRHFLAAFGTQSFLFELFSPELMHAVAKGSPKGTQGCGRVVLSDAKWKRVCDERIASTHNPLDHKAGVWEGCSRSSKLIV